MPMIFEHVYSIKLLLGNVGCDFIQIKGAYKIRFNPQC
jgi:hypothetical protein